MRIKADVYKRQVVYYSASGTTEKIAKYIANAANADIFEIQPVEPYTACLLYTSVMETIITILIRVDDYGKCKI